jgi:very-short-patch-repair endonuclease
MREGQKVDAARRLRTAMTDAERRLWLVLRRRQLGGLHFRRQCPLGLFVVDFACLARRLVVEVDGGQHCDSQVDARRDAWLRRQGFRVLRFWNHEVMGNLDGVYEVIAAAAGDPCRR